MTVKLLRQATLCVALLMASLYAGGVWALTPVEYEPGNIINFHTHAQSLSAQVSVQDERDIIEHHIDREDSWVAAADRGRGSLFSSDYQWQRLRLTNPTDGPANLYLRHNEPSLIEGHFVILREDGSEEKTTVGTSRPFAERPISHRTYLIPFTLAPGESATLLTGHDGRSVVKSTDVVDWATFWGQSEQGLVGDGMYFGASLIVSLLVALLFVANRDRLYLYFYVIIFGNLAYVVVREGYAYQYLWPNWSGSQDELVLIAVNLSIIGAICFSRRFLSLTENNGAWLYHVSNLYLGWNLVLIAFIPLIPTGLAASWVIFNMLLMPVYYLLVLTYSLARASAGDKRALAYSLAWLVYFVPKVTSIAWSVAMPLEPEPGWVQARNGELFFAMVLCLVLMLEFRQNFIKTQARQAASEARTRFLTGVSHELRTPLNGVLGSAELLAESELNSSQRHYTEIISNSGNVLLNLINDTLDLAKYDEHEIALEQVPYHLDRLLAECTANFLPQISRKKLPLFLDVGPEVPLRLLGDEFRLRQVLFNLLSNAVKFTRRGMVSLRVSAEVDGQRPAKVTFVVKDTGIGISEESLERIFEPFGQAEASTTREYGGSGLGLAISKAIIEHMGGTITVRSRIGEGSEFTIQLPIKVNRSAEAERLQRLQRLRGKRVLLLADYGGVFDAIFPNLRSWGVEFDLVSDLDAARKKLQSLHYDVMAVYLVTATEESLEEVRKLGLNTVLMHHSSLPFDPDDWAQKVVDLPIPAGVQDIGDTFIEVIDHSSEVTDEVVATGVARPVRRVFSGEEAAVLVVEDNAINQMVTAGMLEYLGLQPDLAENGQDACQMAAKKRYDLVLMDCNMPVMDGYAAAKRILALDQEPPPIIVALTADAQAESIRRCKEVGMRHVLHKPLSIKELHDYLSQLRDASVSELR